MQKWCLVFYPNINIFDEKASGGVAHLIANIVGYNACGIKCVAICSFHYKIMVFKEGNIYLNIVFKGKDINILDTPNPLSINETTTVKSVAKIIKRIVKYPLDKFYSTVLFRLIQIVKPVIYHERATKRFDVIAHKYKMPKNIKTVYEINDFDYNERSFQSADIILVTDQNNYPKRENYFSHPWPVSFSITNKCFNTAEKFDKRIVYMGSGMLWHAFDFMIRVIDRLNEVDSGWVLDVYAPIGIGHHFIENKNINYCGFINNDDISDMLIKYRYGFAIYNSAFDQNRISVGSPMKIIHYLASSVMPITNMVNDLFLKENFNKCIILVDDNVDKVVEIIFDINRGYSGFKCDPQLLEQKYSPKSYFSNMLNVLYNHN